MIVALKFKAEKVKKLIEGDMFLTWLYERLKIEEGKSNAEALEIIFNNEIIGNSVLERKYDAGETRRKLGRAEIKDIKEIHQREYLENWKIVDEIAGRLGCDLGSFDPGWRLHFRNHCIDIPYEIMRELALMLGYKWIDKK